jgi:hypothetical protein
MSGRAWAIATTITGIISLGLFVVFAMLPEMRAAADCLPPGSVVQFEFARNVSDLITIFGEPESACRPLAIAAMDAVNRIDIIAFIPAYTTFCICAALFLANGAWQRPLVIAALGAAVLAAAADYLETTTLLALTQTLDAPGGLLQYSQLGAWSKFALLATHAVFCAGICYTAAPRRTILAVLLLLPALGVAAAATNHITLANVMNGAFTIAWVALLAAAVVSAVRGRGVQA